MKTQVKSEVSQTTKVATFAAVLGIAFALSILVNFTFLGFRIAATGQTQTISQYGITWNLDKAYPFGQFANGDYWVVGPVTVTSIVVNSPQSSPGGGRHGSMINPLPTAIQTQGYDSRVVGYKASVNEQFPIVVGPDQSLVSSISWIDGEPGFPDAQNSKGDRPYLKTAAVLTVVSEPKSVDILRPAYSGSQKRYFSTSQIRWDLLPSLEPTSFVPILSNMEAQTKRPWIDHVQDWSGRFVHPSKNMPDYAREMSTTINGAILYLMLNIPRNQKEILMNNVLEIGIDNFALLDNGGSWGEIGGGQGTGRKWQTLFAGIILNDPVMKNIGTTHKIDLNGWFTAQEDCQTFRVTQADHDRFPSVFPVVGAPAWAQRHCARPSTDNQRSYRVCCTANAWLGAVLGARLMNAVDLWNHQVLFEYQDLYMDEMAETYGVGNSRRSTSRFVEQMWDTYRASIGSLPVSPPPPPPSCTPSWSCNTWSLCSQNGTQTRICSDINSCGTNANKPAEIQTCTVSQTPPAENSLVTHLSFDSGHRVFSSPTDKVEVSTTGMNINQGTIVVRVQPSSFPSRAAYFLGHTGQVASAYSSRIQLYTDENTGNLDIGFGDSHTLAQNVYDLTENQWYDIALAWNSGTLSVYVDGQIVHQGTYAGLDTLNSILNAGNTGNAVQNDQAFLGLLDDIKIYNYQLTSSEILELFGQSGTGGPDSLQSIQFIPHLEGRSVVSDKDVTLEFYDSQTKIQKGEFTEKTNTQTGALPLWSALSLEQGTYDIVISAPGYLKKRFSNQLLTDGKIISLPTLLAGDFNGDNIVNSLDFSMMNAVWFAAHALIDVNGDGIVNSLDFSFLNKNWFNTGDS